jgi:hypothetical protein
MEDRKIKVGKHAGPNETLPTRHKTKPAYLNLTGSSDAESAARESMRLDHIADNNVSVPGICGKSTYDSHRIIHLQNQLL